VKQVQYVYTFLTFFLSASTAFVRVGHFKNDQVKTRKKAGYLVYFKRFAYLWKLKKTTQFWDLELYTKYTKKQNIENVHKRYCYSSKEESAC
jgi:hypothetical protein